MNVTRFVQRPFVLILILEVFVAIGAGAVVWHLREPQTPPASVHAPPLPSEIRPSPVPTIPTPPAPSPGTAAAGAPPGFRTDPGFLDSQLWDINRDQAVLEKSEWQVTQLIEQGAMAYVQHVVMPAVESAQQSTRRTAAP